VAYVRAIAADPASVDNGRLPGIRALADGSGISHVTILRAVKELERAGTLSARRGSGIFLADAVRRRQSPRRARTKPSPEARVPLSESVYRRFERDILANVFAPGALLPTAKELGYRYGVCDRTITRCAERALSSSLLTMERRRLRVAPAMLSHGRGHVVLIAAGSGKRDLPDMDQRQMAHTHGLEAACAQTGLGLRRVFYGPAESGLHVMDGKGPPYTQRELEDILGFAVLARALQDLGFGDFFRRLSSYGKPVSILDENGLVTDALSVGIPASVCVFSAAHSPRSGADMASFLLQRRHLRVAYISPFHGEPWSQNRLRGLIQFYRDAGHPDAVVPVTAESIGWLSADRLASSMAAASRAAPGRKLRLEKTLPEGIDRLLAGRDITAWVAANDAVGIACLRLLAERGIRVPGQVSVAGFDDSYFALVNGLTSYNFNAPALTQAMIKFIVNPSWPPVRRRTQESIEVDGFMNERESTGPARA